MRSLLWLLSVVAVAFAHDAVLFSSVTNIGDKFPSIANLAETASPSAPLFILVNPDFTLGQFSRHAAAYQANPASASAIVNAAKKANSVVSRHISRPVHVDSDWETVSSTTPFQKGASVYVVSGDSWESLEQLSRDLLSLPNTAVLITDSEFLSTNAPRVKRVSIADAGMSLPLPLVLPPFNMTEAGSVKKLPCLLYLEGLNFILETRASNAKATYLTAILRENGTFEWDESFVTCPDVNFTKGTPSPANEFTVKITPKDDPSTTLDAKEKLVVSGPFHLKLSIEMRYDGYWKLKKLELLDDITFNTNSGSKKAQKGISLSADQMGMNSVFGYGWNCHNSEAAFFKTDDDNARLGISFHNIQVQIHAHDSIKREGLGVFNLKIDSCTGTFSAASWMGIISALVLFAVFLFGFLMLNSVQTMDRFDDPKQKQILINVRE